MKSKKEPPTMDTIKNIKITKNKFIVITNNNILSLNCESETGRYIVDISKLNLINATSLAILCSTYCFINNFKKKICWVVADEEIKRGINILSLKNVEISLADNYINKRMELVS